LQRRVLGRNCFDAIVRDIAMIKEEATFNNSGNAEPEDWKKSAEQRHIFSLLSASDARCSISR
jgi:hypothetical protein